MEHFNVNELPVLEFSSEAFMVGIVLTDSFFNGLSGVTEIKAIGGLGVKDVEGCFHTTELLALQKKPPHRRF